MRGRSGGKVDSRQLKVEIQRKTTIQHTVRGEHGAHGDETRKGAAAEKPSAF